MSRGQGPALAVVPPKPAPSSEPVDIAAQWRADVRKRDWARVHVEGDRNPPIFLLPRRWRWS